MTTFQSAQLGTLSILEVETKFADWIKRRIEEYEFVQDVDFCHVLKFEKMEQGGQRKSVDYFLTIGMAKELSMVERNAKGKEARKYFIACEKKLRQQPKPKYNLAFIERAMMNRAA